MSAVDKNLFLLTQLRRNNTSLTKGHHALTCLTGPLGVPSMEKPRSSNKREEGGTVKGIRTLFIALVVVAAMPAKQVIAAQHAQINPWSDCGIGAMIFPNNDTAAIISNIIWDLGTTAVTSAEASKQTCKGHNVVAARFVYRSYANLEQETAVGTGEHIVAVLNILGCPNDSEQHIAMAVRKDFAAVLQNPQYTSWNRLEKAKSYYNILKSDTRGFCPSA